MSFLKNIFGKKDEPIQSYGDFWKWFQKNEKAFFKAVKNGKNIEEDFFSKLGPALAQVKDGIYYLCGMDKENKADLIFSAEGNVKNIVFIEELVNAAPPIDGWKFTALKPALSIENVRIEMAGYTFDSDNLWFYADDEEGFPDEIAIGVVHNDLDESNKSPINNGIFIFLDNYLGELNFASTVDNVVVSTKENAKAELIPIEKLKDFLVWREKEFVEKYEGSRFDTDKDQYGVMEGKLKSGNKIIAVLNRSLLEWDRKASHQWIVTIEIPYDGSQNNGLPDKETYQLLDDIEKELTPHLKDSDGYLYVGRQTADNMRQVYFACKDFRKPSKLAYQLQQKYAGTVELDYTIEKDKYWYTFNRFTQKG